jgi:hypothetical protein
VPAQFSWVDQRLVREGYLERCDARAAALYLFLVTVADAQGLSYYGEASLKRRLRLGADELNAARERLIELQLLAYQAPIYQVLALPGAMAAAPSAPSPACDRDKARAWLAQLRSRVQRHHA